jgi:hypothetical protein
VLPDELFRFTPPLGAQRVAFDELLDLIDAPGNQVVEGE